MDTKLFQEKSLAKLKKPEGDDKLFRVVPSLGWVGLATVMIVIFSILIWSFFGIMADKVAGYGIILDKEGINSVSTMASGRIVQQNYSLGDRVQEGDILAYIEQGKEEQQLMYQLEVAADSTSQSEMKRQVAELSSMKKGRNTDGQLRSPYTGVVVNVRADEGDVVSVGIFLHSLLFVYEFQNVFIDFGFIIELLDNFGTVLHCYKEFVYTFCFLNDVRLSVLILHKVFRVCVLHRSDCQPQQYLQRVPYHIRKNLLGKYRLQHI